MKGVLKAVGVLMVLMAMGSVIAEDQSTMVSNGTTIVLQQVPLPIPIPGGGGTTNWGGGGPGSGNGEPCVGC